MKELTLKNKIGLGCMAMAIGLIGGMECGDIGFEAGITYAVISICLALILTK